MVEEDPLKWAAEPVENFFDVHSLYRGVHRTYWQYWVDLDHLEPNFLQEPKPREKGFSTDWSKYATPQTTFDHLRDPTLTTNGIVEINVGNLRRCIATNNFPLALQHDPIRVAAPGQACNRAHTLIIGITQGRRGGRYS